MCYKLRAQFWESLRRMETKKVRVAIWHMYGIHTYISLTLKHLYMKLYSGSNFGPEVCKKC